MSTTPLMPAAFLGHGSPMNALERNRYTEAWRAFGAAVPIEITATDLGKVGWILIIVSGAVVLAGTWPSVTNMVAKPFPVIFATSEPDGLPPHRLIVVYGWAPATLNVSSPSRPSRVNVCKSTRIRST